MNVYNRLGIGMFLSVISICLAIIAKFPAEGIGVVIMNGLIGMILLGIEKKKK